MRIIILLILSLSLCIKSTATVLFETDFSETTSEWTAGSGGHVVAGTHNTTDPGLGVPEPFTGYINHSPNNSMKILTSGGRSNNGSVWRIGPEYDTTTNQVGLAVYLPNTSGVYDYQGYTELYIRFYFKYSDNWDWIYPGGTFSYHKWLRIWQNVPENRIKGLPPGEGEPNQSMSFEENTGYIVMGVGEDNYSEFSPYFYAALCADDTANSSDGNQLFIKNYTYADNEAFLENVTGSIDANGLFTETQDWHSFEVHIKLASSPSAADGLVEIWLDGVKQGAMDEYRYGFYPYDEAPDNLFPTDQLGVGINYISIMDNASYFDWSEQAYIYIDDVVISTEYIGPDYDIGIDETAPISGVSSISGVTFQ
jgi:hypothetical protein